MENQIYAFALRNRKNDYLRCLNAIRALEKNQPPDGGSLQQIGIRHGFVQLSAESVPEKIKNIMENNWQEVPPETPWSKLQYLFSVTYDGDTGDSDISDLFYFRLIQQEYPQVYLYFHPNDQVADMSTYSKVYIKASQYLEYTFQISGVRDRCFGEYEKGRIRKLAFSSVGALRGFSPLIEIDDSNSAGAQSFTPIFWGGNMYRSLLQISASARKLRFTRLPLLGPEDRARPLMIPQNILKNKKWLASCLEYFKIARLEGNYRTAQVQLTRMDKLFQIYFLLI